VYYLLNYKALPREGRGAVGSAGHQSSVTSSSDSEETQPFSVLHETRTAQHSLERSKVSDLRSKLRVRRLQPEIVTTPWLLPLCNIELPLNAVRTGKTKNRNYRNHNTPCVVTARQLRFDRQAGRSEGAQDFQGDDSGVALQPSLIQKLTCPKMDMRSFSCLERCRSAAR
jgi:hypothetical protein